MDASINSCSGEACHLTKLVVFPVFNNEDSPWSQDAGLEYPAWDFPEIPQIIGWICKYQVILHFGPLDKPECIILYYLQMGKV